MDIVEHIEDFREKWINDRILSYFDENDSKLLENFLNRPSGGSCERSDNNEKEHLFENDMGLNRKQFENFLNANDEKVIDIKSQIFVVYKTYHCKMVEEEVEIKEKVLKPRSGSFFSQDDKKKDGKRKRKKKSKKTIKEGTECDKDIYMSIHDDGLVVDDDYNENLDDEQDQNGEVEAQKHSKILGRSCSPRTIIENSSQSEHGEKNQTTITSYVTVKKLVEKVIQVPQLQGFFGTIQESELAPVTASCYVYFIKKANRKVPICTSEQAATLIMPLNFFVGNLTDDPLENMSVLFTSIFLPNICYLKNEDELENLITETINDRNVFTDNGTDKTTAMTISTKTKVATATRGIPASTKANSTTLMVEHKTTIRDETALTTLPAVNEESINFQDVILQRRPSYYFSRNFIYKYIRTNSGIYEDTLKNVSQRQLPLSSHTTHHVQYASIIDQLLCMTNTINWAREELSSRSNLIRTSVEFNNHDSNNATKTKEDVKNSLCAWISKLESYSLQLMDIAEKVDISKYDLLYEYKYWKETELKLATITDELSEFISKTEWLTLKEDPSLFQLISHFNKQEHYLRQTVTEVKEIADLQRTHSCFFKILTFGSYKQITEILPTLMKSLKSVWILSKYYCREENMRRLLISIRDTLCDRIKSKIDVTTLFREDAEPVNELLDTAIRMLEIWKSSYLQIRTCLEATDDFFIKRWEFDKSSLFSSTDYIRSVILDIRHIFQVVQHFKNIFACNLRKIIQNSCECDTMNKKMTELTLLIEKVDFDIYQEIFRDEWQEVLDIFEQNVLEMDQRLKILVIKTFSHIRSVNDAVEIVKDILKIETRPTVHDSLPYICNKIIIHFMKDIKLSDQIFQRKKSMKDVDIYKIYDLVCWSKNLIKKLQYEIDILKSIHESSATSSSLFQQAMNQFHELELEVQNYVTLIYKQWCGHVTTLLLKILDENVTDIEPVNTLITGIHGKSLMNKSSLTSEEHKWNEENGPVSTTSSILKRPDDSGRTRSLLLPNKQDFGIEILTTTMKWMTKRNKMGQHCEGEEFQKTVRRQCVNNTSLLIERGLKLRIKIQKEIIFDIVETCYRLQLDNFQLPKEIGEFLSIKERVYKNIKLISDITEKYNELMVKLATSFEEVMLMKHYLMKIEMTIQFGVNLYTWKSAVLQIYCQNVLKKCEQLFYLKYLADKIFAKLDLLVDAIGIINFFPIENVSSANVNYKEFFQIVDQLQMKQIEKCSIFYERISLALIQLENLILYTNSGRSNLMTYYYEKYKNEITASLIKSILKSMLNMKKMLEGELQERFYVNCYLQNGEIKLEPMTDQLFESMKLWLIRLFSRLKCLKPWEYGSCIQQKQMFSDFYRQLIENEDIIQNCASILDSLCQLCNSLNESSSRWFKYSILWKYDKDATVEVFATQNTNLSDYEIRFDFYSNLIEKIEEEPQIITVFCVNVKTEKLLCQLREHCSDWKSKLGSQLILDTKQMISSTSSTIRELSSTLDMEVTSICNLTKILSTIIEIQRIANDIELNLFRIREHCYELFIQKFKITDENMEQKTMELEYDWKILYKNSLRRKFLLEPVREDAFNKMKLETYQFSKECFDFTHQFHEEYSTVFEVSDFDIRVQWISKFSKMSRRLLHEKLRLQQIQQCFEIASYSSANFESVIICLDKLCSKYKLDYEE